MSAVSPPRAADQPTDPAAEGPRGRVKASPRPPEHVVRRRRLVALAALGVVLALASAGFLALRGSGTPPPATGAARVVPADALAYVHLSTDSTRPSVPAARRLASRFPDYPLLYAAVMSRVNRILGAGDIRPWLGNEAAVAVLGGTGSSAATVLVLDVSNRPRAQAFLSSAGAAPAGAYGGVRLLAYPSGSEAALIGHYLVAGPAVGVRAAIDAWRGRSPSLARNAGYERAAATEPADRVLDAYLTPAGVRQLLGARTGVAGAIGLLLDRPDIKGTAISLSAIPGGARVVVHSVLSGASQPASFRPTLQSVLPSGSTLMLDVDGLDRVAPELLRVGTTAGIGANIAPLLRRLGAALASQGVNLRNVESVFDGETAVALSPAPSPALLIVSRLHNQAAARSELVSLDAPLTALFSPTGSAAAGQVPELSATQVGTATIQEVQLGPGLQVDFGVFDGVAVVSTSVRAIAEVAQRSRALAGEGAYQAVLPAGQGQGQVSSLIFGDFTRILGLAEQTGLTSGARTRELLPDLSKIRTIGVSSTSGKNQTTTTLTLEIP
jgi:hypothetical protein